MNDTGAKLGVTAHRDLRDTLKSLLRVAVTIVAILQTIVAHAAVLLSAENPSAATYFAYDDAGHILGEYDASGATIEETVWLGDLPIATLRSAGAFYVAPDHLGAPHQITNALGQTVWSWDHDPFGNGAPQGRFDAETGLYNNDPLGPHSLDATYKHCRYTFNTLWMLD